MSATTRRRAHNRREQLEGLQRRLAVITRFHKEKRLSFGVYPDVNLKSARQKRDAARQQLAAGIDPGQARKAEKLAQAGAESFEAIAREWHAKFSPGWV